MSDIKFLSSKRNFIKNAKLKNFFKVEEKFCTTRVGLLAESNDKCYETKKLIANTLKGNASPWWVGVGRSEKRRDLSSPCFRFFPTYFFVRCDT